MQIASIAIIDKRVFLLDNLFMNIYIKSFFVVFVCGIKCYGISNDYLAPNCFSFDIKKFVKGFESFSSFSTSNMSRKKSFAECWQSCSLFALKCLTHIVCFPFFLIMNFIILPFRIKSFVSVYPNSKDDALNKMNATFGGKFHFFAMIFTCGLFLFFMVTYYDIDKMFFDKSKKNVDTPIVEQTSSAFIPSVTPVVSSPAENIVPTFSAAVVVSIMTASIPPAPHIMPVPAGLILHGDNEGNKAK